MFRGLNNLVFRWPRPLFLHGFWGQKWYLIYHNHQIPPNFHPLNHPPTWITSFKAIASLIFAKYSPLGFTFEICKNPGLSTPNFNFAPKSCNFTTVALYLFPTNKSLALFDAGGTSTSPALFHKTSLEVPRGDPGDSPTKPGARTSTVTNATIFRHLRVTTVSGRRRVAETTMAMGFWRGKHHRVRNRRCKCKCQSVGTFKPTSERPWATKKNGNCLFGSALQKIHYWQ